MKKQRGLKRYYKNLDTKIDFNEIDRLDFESPQSWFENRYLQFNLKPYGNNTDWFYNWHIHFDRKGFGNNTFKARKPHLDTLFRHFDILAEKTKSLKTSFQLYAVLLDYHSASEPYFCTHQSLMAVSFHLKFRICN